MSADETPGPPPRRRRAWYIALAAALALVLLAVGGAAIVQFWVAPGLVESRVRQRLGRIWDGPVEMQDVRFRYPGSVAIDQLTLAGPTGRPWVRMDGVHLEFNRLISSSWRLARVVVDSADVRLYSNHRIPIRRRPPPPAAPRPPVPSIVVNDIAVALYAEEAGATYVKDLRLALELTPAGYAVTLAPAGYAATPAPGAATPAAEPVYITGVVDPAFETAALQVRTNLTLSGDQVSVLLAALGLSPAYGGHGTIWSDLSVEGSRTDWANVALKGRAGITDGALVYRKVSVVSTFSLPCDINETVATARLTGRALDGDLSGLITVAHRGLTLSAFRVHVDTSALHLAGLAAAFKSLGPISQGVLSSHYVFRGRTLDIHDVNGAGALYVQNTEIQVLPIFSQIFEALKIARPGASLTSDAAFALRNAGPRVTILDGEVANRTSAIKVEPGGVVNLQARTVDMYIIFVTLEQVESILGKIPVVNWFVHIKDKLIRFHVVGAWNEPASELVKKEPLKDVSEAAFGFIVDAARTGGHLGQGVFKALQSLAGDGG